MVERNEIIIYLVLCFIISATIFDIAFSIFVFKFIKDKRKRNRALIHYIFLSIIILLFIALAIVHHSGAV